MLHPNPTQNLVVNVAPEFSQKPTKLRQEHNIDPSKLVENEFQISGNDQQPQHNEHSYVFTCICSLCMSMCGLQFSTSKAEKLKELI